MQESTGCLYSVVSPTSSCLVGQGRGQQGQGKWDHKVDEQDGEGRGPGGKGWETTEGEEQKHGGSIIQGGIEKGGFVSGVAEWTQEGRNSLRDLAAPRAPSPGAAAAPPVLPARSAGGAIAPETPSSSAEPFLGVLQSQPPKPSPQRSDLMAEQARGLP